MFKFIVINILRLWCIVFASVALVPILGKLMPNSSLLYLEHTPFDQENAIWMIDTERGLRYRLVQKPYLEAFDLSPNGQTIAYQVDIGKKSEMFLLSLTTDHEEKIATVHVECPRWSPDGQTLMFQNYDTMSLYTMDVASHDVSRFMYLGSGIARCSYDWSPDGSTLIHTEWPRANGQSARVVLTGLDTDESTILIRTNRPVRQLVVSPDGSAITYDGQSYATIIDMTNQEIINLSYFAYTYSASWSPNQEYIAFGYQKPLINIAQEIPRGIAIINTSGEIQFQADVGRVSHVSWWGE
jgi:Tol biopolymer transport system component